MSQRALQLLTATVGAEGIRQTSCLKHNAAALTTLIRRLPRPHSTALPVPEAWSLVRFCAAACQEPLGPDASWLAAPFAGRSERNRHRYRRQRQATSGLRGGGNMLGARKPSRYPEAGGQQHGAHLVCHMPHQRSKVGVFRCMRHHKVFWWSLPFKRACLPSSLLGSLSLFAPTVHPPTRHHAALCREYAEINAEYVKHFESEFLPARHTTVGFAGGAGKVRENRQHPIPASRDSWRVSFSHQLMRICGSRLALGASLL